MGGGAKALAQRQEGAAVLALAGSEAVQSLPSRSGTFYDFSGPQRDPRGTQGRQVVCDNRAVSIAFWICER